MHQRPHQGRPDARWPRAGKTQACITKAQISFAIQVGRRERADATSSSSDEGNLTRSLRIVSAAFSGPN